MLRPDPRQEPRLVAIIANLHDRVVEATERGWLGEVEGLQVSLDAARHKLDQMDKDRSQPPVIPLDTPKLWGPAAAPGRAHGR
jgi:hypothetical protein